MQGFDEFIKLCCSIEDFSKMKSVFDVFLTHEERNAIQTRLEIVKELLLNRMTQRQIAAEYKVSIATITRGSNDLKRLDSRAKEELKVILGISDAHKSN